MSKVIVKNNPSVNYRLYLKEISLVKGNNKCSTVSHTFTSSKGMAMVFDDDRYLEIALELLNISKDNSNRNCTYSIEESDKN